MTFTDIRTALARSSAASRERRQLARDIASYRTPAERLDFEATLERYPDEDTAYLRAVLAQAA